MRLVVALRAIVEHGDYIRRENIDHPRRDGIVAFHIIDADVVIAGRRKRVRVEVGEDPFGALFYDLFGDASAHEGMKKAAMVSLEPKSKVHGGPGSVSLALDSIILDTDGKSNLDFGQWMLKSEHGPIPAGAHWITVHPNGAGKGHPILVMPQSDGSMRVIGGAGGALNHLKLRSVKQGQSLKDAARQRQQERQEARKKQIEADKAAGIHEQKQAAKSALRESMKKQRQEFVKTVADLMGWDSKTLDGGKTMRLTVHSSNPKKWSIPIRVRFGSENDHAYTDDAGGKQMTRERVF